MVVKWEGIGLVLAEWFKGDRIGMSVPLTVKLLPQGILLPPPRRTPVSRLI